jgi:hypothetical protein
VTPQKKNDDFFGAVCILQIRGFGKIDFFGVFIELGDR